MNRKKSILILVIFFCTIAGAVRGQSQPLEVPAWNQSIENSIPSDWLIIPSKQKAGIYRSSDGKDVILYNGFVKRSFRVEPNAVCTGYQNMINGQQLLRAISPEARVTIDGKSYNVGGLYGQSEKAYLLPQWLNEFKKNENDFQFASYEVRSLAPYLNWKSTTWATNRNQPTGKQIIFSYESRLPMLKGLTIKIHYELYDGLPLICKWLSIENKSEHSFNVDRVVNEILATVEEESAVIGRPETMKTQNGIYVETNYAFNNSMRYALSDQTLHWKIDSSYTSQVNYDYNTPCLLEVYPDKGPGIVLLPKETFNSIRTYELLIDSYDRERKGLAIRKMYRIIAPWTTSNPIFMHLVSKNDDEVKTAIDQCAGTGYEALILSFGSHLTMEDSSASNIQKWKSLAQYAHVKGILIGGYSLFSSRKISEEDDVINPKTGKTGGAFFSNAPCFGSKWGLAYRDKIKYFFQKTGFDIWENDGPYPGDVCASTTHPGHKGLQDSQWRQIEIQKDLYHWMNERGIYLNVPDWYFLDGTHKVGIGYREVNFSLPRENQKILNRQNIFDGTWEKTPSMGWGFVPLTRYQGGGADAVLEPLSQHLKDYEQLMIQYYGAGVQACYRGSRLYDTDETKRVVVNVIKWYKRYREILNSDIIHLRRADGRDWDGIIHVNPQLTHRGLVMLYNPTKETIKKTIRLPLYYTALTEKATIREKEGVSKTYLLNRDYEVELPVTLEADSYSWWIID